ncbi:glycosyltransferase family 2 protein [Salegentibacter chungangensis]|uniref:Glycosyltransferase family 2 protein n=1 Tax=Salegentibacter chungangensis TaxID=1335724 RepID=A0ABW3NS90_9FLAO
MSQNLRISIITVNYNNLEGLRKTLQSVFDQTFQEFEFIVIDGASTDGSKEYIEKFQRKIDYWVSEPDEGIYDAMNKGIDQASGKYLSFLNSGDYYVSKDVLSKFIEAEPKKDIVYGDVLIEVKGAKQIKKMPEVTGFVESLTHTINHQAIFFRQRLFQNGARYNCDYRIIADWIFINDAFRRSEVSFQHLDLVVVCYDENGVSSNKHLRWEERDEYLQRNFDKNFLNLLTEYNELQRKYKSKESELNDLKKKILVNKVSRVHDLFGRFKNFLSTK